MSPILLAALFAVVPHQDSAIRILRVDTPVPILYIPGRRPRVVLHPKRKVILSRKPSHDKQPASK